MKFRQRTGNRKGIDIYRCWLQALYIVNIFTFFFSLVCPSGAIFLAYSNVVLFGEKLSKPLFCKNACKGATQSEVK